MDLQELKKSREELLQVIGNLIAAIDGIDGAMPATFVKQKADAMQGLEEAALQIANVINGLILGMHKTEEPPDNEGE
jgi:hypothetical protein